MSRYIYMCAHAAVRVVFERSRVVETWSNIGQTRHALDLRTDRLSVGTVRVFCVPCGTI